MCKTYTTIPKTQKGNLKLKKLEFSPIKNNILTFQEAWNGF
jgi:hypothetical protein